MVFKIRGYRFKSFFTCWVLLGLLHFWFFVSFYMKEPCFFFFKKPRGEISLYLFASFCFAVAVPELQACSIRYVLPLDAACSVLPFRKNGRTTLHTGRTVRGGAARNNCKHPELFRNSMQHCSAVGCCLFRSAVPEERQNNVAYRQNVARRRRAQRCSVLPFCRSGRTAERQNNNSMQPSVTALLLCRLLHAVPELQASGMFCRYAACSGTTLFCRWMLLVPFCRSGRTAEQRCIPAERYATMLHNNGARRRRAQQQHVALLLLDAQHPACIPADLQASRCMHFLKLYDIKNFFFEILNFLRCLVALFHCCCCSGTAPHFFKFFSYFYLVLCFLLNIL
jgi:hypothetical protein